MSDLIGQTFGSYMLESLIGSGPNGQVFRARQVRLNRPAAIKVLSSRLSELPDSAQRFGVAIQRAANLRGAHITDIEDFGEQGGRFYIAMELYEEGSLRTFLQKRIGQREPRELALALDIVRQAADGLHAAHTAGFVHGHIRPENILLQRRTQGGAETFRGRLGDIGLLEAAGSALQINLAYSTPEQTQGITLTPQSDIYTLGVVLYEVATGYVPFAVKTPQDAQAKHGSAAPVPPRMVRQQVPAELEAIILRCLAKAPAQRFASAADLSQALAGVIRANSPAQTVQLPTVPTEPIPTPPQATQKIAIDPAQQPTARVEIPAAQQPTVRTNVPAAQQPTVMASNTPRVELLDRQGAPVRGVDLTGAGVTMGRATDSGIVLEHEQISRYHLRVDWNGQTTTVTDLGSANGTLLDGLRLPANVPVPWSYGKLVQAGPFTLRLTPPFGAAPQAQPALDPLLQGMLNGAQAAPPPQQQTTPPPQQTTQAVSVAPAGPPLRLLLDQDQLTVTPGQREVLGLTVVNNSSAAESVTVTVEGAPGMWVGVPQQALQVPAGGRAPMTLTIGVPRDPESLAGDYQIMVRARASSGETATARGRWTVLPFTSSSVTLAPRRASGRRDADFQVTVRNDSNQAESFLLSAEDDTQELLFSFSEDTITLEPAESATVIMRAEAQSRMFGGDDTFIFTVSAQAGREKPASATGQFTRKAAMPPAVPIVAVLLVALAVIFFLLNPGRGGSGAAGAGTTTATAMTTAVPSPTLLPTLTPTPQPGAPEFSVFELSPTSVQAGQPITITWAVANADSVDLLVNGNVVANNLPASGSTQYLISGNTDITIKAAGGGKETVRTLQAQLATPVPPTATPTAAASATPAPSATPVPPTATAIPTATPEGAPTATPTAAPAPAKDMSFTDVAAQARWSSSTSDTLTFGKPSQGADAGGWAETQGLAQLEHSWVPVTGLLYTVPSAIDSGFIMGEYSLGGVGKGQHFLADIGFPNGTKNTTMQVQVIFNGEIIFDQQKTADGKLLTVDADLSGFAGQEGTLSLHVENVENPGNIGLYWVNPRVATK